MPIKFRCPDCKAKIKVSEQFAGQLGVCPTCRKRTRIPEASDPEFAEEMAGKTASGVAAAGSETPEKKASAVQLTADEADTKSAEEPVQADKPKADEAKPTESKSAPAFIRFKCPNCEKPTGFPSQMAGKPATCPLCKMQVMVPEESGGESFVVGMAPATPKARSAVARAPSHLSPALPSGSASVQPSSPAASSKPPWLLIGAVGGGLLLVAVLIGVVIGMMGKNQTPEQQAAANPPVATQPAQPTAPAPPPATPVTEPHAGPQVPAREPTESTPPATQEPTTPYLPPVTVPLETRTDEPAPAVAPAKADTPATTEAASEKPETPAADPTALIPTTLPSQKVLKDDDETPEKPADTATDAVQNLLDGGAKTTANTPKAPEEPQTIDPVPKPPPCAKCLSVGYLPIPNTRPYVYVYGEKPPDPSVMVPWVYCDQCMKDHDNKELLAIEAERFARSMQNNQKWDTLLSPIKAKIIHLETRHVLLHCELPLPLAKQVATTLDKLASLLESRTRSVLLTQTRPDVHEIVILGSTGSYNALISALEKVSPGDEWSMFRKSMGFSMGKIAIYNAGESGQAGPEPMAIYQMSKMFIGSACGGKAPPWLAQGFSSHCENQLTHRNLCYTFVYELNDSVRFGENWNQDIRKYALQGQLKKWDYIFPMDMVGLKPLDYLTCYSMVNFFMGDPARFIKMVAEIRDGATSSLAIEKTYGRPIKDLQVMWANWAVQQR